jgi:formate/nitrite transporter FocA (FNT family)
VHIIYKNPGGVIMRTLISGILAGLCVSIGGCVYLNISNNIIAAIFFSIALLMVCYLELHLYTGKIGFVINNHNKKDLADLGLMLIGNIVGTICMGLLSLKMDTTKIETVINNKMALNIPLIFINAFMCGVLMYVAVYIYKHKNSIVGILFCIPTFILCGFEHVIADCYYFVAAREITLSSILFLGITLIGNTIGAIAFALLHYNIRKNK